MQSLASVVIQDVKRAEHTITATDMVNEFENDVTIKWVDPPSEYYSFVVVLSDELKREKRDEEAIAVRNVIFDTLSENTESIADVEIRGLGTITKGPHKGMLVVAGDVSG